MLCVQRKHKNSFPVTHTLIHISPSICRVVRPRPSRFPLKEEIPSSNPTWAAFYEAKKSYACATTAQPSSPPPPPQKKNRLESDTSFFEQSNYNYIKNWEKQYGLRFFANFMVVFQQFYFYFYHIDFINKTRVDSIFFAISFDE